jgi:hypothetical protein
LSLEATVEAAWRVADFVTATKRKAAMTSNVAIVPLPGETGEG